MIFPQAVKGELARVGAGPEFGNFGPLQANFAAAVRCLKLGDCGHFKQPKNSAGGCLTSECEAIY